MKKTNLFFAFLTAALFCAASHAADHAVQFFVALGDRHEWVRVTSSHPGTIVLECPETQERCVLRRRANSWGLGASGKSAPRLREWTTQQMSLIVSSLESISQK